MAKNDLVDDDEDFEDGSTDDDESFDDESSLEKSFDAVFSEDKVVYFLESNGSWFKNTFDSKEDASKVAEIFSK